MAIEYGFEETKFYPKFSVAVQMITDNIVKNSNYGFCCIPSLKNI